MLKLGLKELLREREKGVLRTAHPRTPFQIDLPPGGVRIPIFKENLPEKLDPFRCQILHY